LGRIDHVIVPGERAWQCVRQLGFAESRISRGMYGIDASSFGEVAHQRFRSSDRWPGVFCYMGRYIDSKGIADLCKAYQRYRRDEIDPWPLVTCGRGPLQPLLLAAGA